MAEHDMVHSMTKLSELPRYLPPEIAEHDAEECRAREPLILQLLSSDPAPPPASELAFGLRCLKSMEEQKMPTGLDFKIAVCSSLWKLLLASASAGQARPLYGYANRTKILDNLRSWLCHLDVDHIQPFWREAISQDETDAAEPIAKLFAQLDIRVILRLLIEEVRRSPRTDCSINNSKRRNYVHHLANLCIAFSHLPGSISIAQGSELMEQLASNVDAVHVYSLFYAKMLALLTPRKCIPQLLLDGRLWNWWSRLPEGLLPKFDLMWFMPLARFAELRWANKVEDALTQTGQAGQSEKCWKNLQEQLPWLMNKICRTLCLPFGSPASKALDGKEQSFPDVDRYVIPEEIDTVLMGNQSAWKDVAFFLVYTLEPTPPSRTDGSDGKVPSMWDFLSLLQRRMRPFLTPATCQGEWLWHCVTFLHNLISIYFRRICKERMLRCTTSPDMLLSASADQAFIELIMPLVRDLMMVRGPYEMATSMENIAKLTQISAMYASAGNLDLGAPIDPFKTDFQSMVMQSTDLLNDPTQSARHVSLLRVFSSVVPALSLQMPAVIGELLPLMLQGIDPTDTPKTMSALRLLLCVLINVPCLDSNDWQLGDHPTESRLRWPLPKDSKLKVGDPDCSATGLVSSMLPPFAIELVERACDYVTRIPKPRNVKSGKVSLELATMGLLHGALTIAGSQTDKETYKQMLDVLCQFLGSHLLPDQVKPAGLLVFAVVRACPEMAIPVVLPVIFKKLLVHQPKSSVLPLHESGVSESEAKWWLSLLCSAVRCGGAALLPHRHELEIIMRATFLDEREAVNKLGMKLLRRILYAITAVYVSNDYRLCNDQVWQSLMGCRLGSATPPKPGLTTLVWSGAQPPWWFEDPDSAVQWHMPSDEEVSFARDLVFGVLMEVGEMLAPTMGITIPSLDIAGANTSWLAQLSSNLPSKKKLAHSAVLGIRLVNSVLRGTCDLWPDERGNEELQQRQLPMNLKIAGDTAKIIFPWLSQVLLSAFKVLAAQEQYGSVAPTSGKLDPIDVSRVMRKLLKCVAELIGAFSDTHPSSLRLFPSLRHVEKHAAGLALQSTSLEMLHPHSRWRDLPRVWWVERVADTMENRVHERRGGHRYQGQRRELIEELTKQIFSSGFSAVRARAMETVAMAVQYHQGCRWPLVRDVLMPALAKETTAVLQCGTLTGDAADKEQQRLNDALSGLAASLAGGIQGLVWGVWRRGMDDASKLGYDLCEAIYAATRVGQGGGAHDTKRCEVKPNTVAKLIGALRHWLDCREVQCWAPTRPRTSSVASLQDEFQSENDGAPNGKLPAGIYAMRTVSKAMDLCERADCHWRAQIMTSTMCLALLNALGPSGCPPDLEPSLEAEVREVWMKWGRWLVKCIEPKGQPGLHLLAVHGLLLMLKRSTNESSILKSAHLAVELQLAQSSFFQNLLQVLPPLHHEDLMATADDQMGQKSEPTRDPVNVMTNSGFFDVWPRIWLRRSSRSFSIRNVLFWQSYVNFLKSQVSVATLLELLRSGAEELASQPVAEAEFHAALTELVAGTLRAVRKPEEKELRDSLWTAIRPWLLSELQKSSEERLGGWCDAVRFIVTGCKRPKLATMFPEKVVEEDMQFLVPLFNFVLCGDGELECNSLSCTLPPIKFDYESSDASDSPKESSSFDSFKRLRLLMSLLIEPKATKTMAASQEFCKKLVETLELGLGHPYKQLREEVARGLYFIVEAAAHASSLEESSGLKAVAATLEGWFATEARRLTGLLRADNAAHVTPEDAARPRHVVESSGLLYLLLHSSLNRMSSHHLRASAEDWMQFIAAAAAHGDIELRAIAPHAMSLCCSSHPLAPTLENPRLWSTLPMVRALQPLLGEGAIEKELEKAFSAGLKPAIVANFFVLLTGGEDTSILYHEMRSAAERALGLPKPEIRTAARSAVASFLTLEGEAELVGRLKSLKVLAGPTRRPHDDATEADEALAFCRAVSAMACMLLAAADCGVPKWSGQAIQAVAPYGKTGKRPGLQELARKEVQSAIQAFLKLQQSSQTSWTECQQKLTPTQLELLNDNKGKLSYFS